MKMGFHFVIIACILVLPLAVYGQDEWFTHSPKTTILPRNGTMPTTHRVTHSWHTVPTTAKTSYWTTTKPWGEEEVCSLVPADNRFLTWNNESWSGYMVMSTGSCYKAGDIVQVNLWGMQYYTGFMLQAHSIWENKPHGWFSLGYNSEGLETATCKDGHANVIKTYRNEFYYNHSFYWHAPYDYQTDIIFNATFIDEWASDGGQYWLNVTSQLVEYDPGCNDNVMVAAGNSLKSGGFLLGMLMCFALQML